MDKSTEPLEECICGDPDDKLFWEVTEDEEAMPPIFLNEEELSTTVRLLDVFCRQKRLLVFK